MAELVQLLHGEAGGVVLKKYARPQDAERERWALDALTRLGFRRAPRLLAWNAEWALFEHIPLPELGVQGYPASLLPCVRDYFSFANRTQMRSEPQRTFRREQFEKLEGRLATLAQWGMVSAPETEEILSRACSGVRFRPTHLVHSDLRPPNILVNPRDASEYFVIDWERARVGDLNRDYAYLYHTTRSHSPAFARALLRLVRGLPTFRLAPFRFYRYYLAASYAATPHDADYWLRVLRA